MVSTYSEGLASGRHLYRAAVEPGQAAQLGVFVLGMQYLYLCVLMCVFGYGCAVYVLVTGQLSCNANDQ